MKILAVADTVTAKLLEKTADGLPYIPDVDLIIGCGDLPPEYLSNLRARYDVPLYYVLGNHDIRHDASPPVGCRLLDRTIITHSGIRITGFSGSRWYNGGLNQYTEQEMAGKIRKMWFQLWRQKGIDLLITHAPPRYINDAEDPCHRGFHVFRKFITRYKPGYLLHGHIHTLFEDQSLRTTTFDATKIINCYGYYTLEIQSS